MSNTSSNISSQETCLPYKANISEFVRFIKEVDFSYVESSELGLSVGDPSLDTIRGNVYCTYESRSGKNPYIKMSFNEYKLKYTNFKNAEKLMKFLGLDISDRFSNGCFMFERNISSESNLTHALTFSFDFVINDEDRLVSVYQETIEINDKDGIRTYRRG